ncbi:MAG: hypothetical protein IJX25_04480 [Clostridia bacterium]|nr:hypothetical protein [Clostridia bacterium]
MDKENTVLKLNKVFKKGYVPSRGSQSYSFVSPVSHEGYFFSANCFAHACFNLTNELIDKVKINLQDSLAYASPIDHTAGLESTEINLLNFIEKTGLKIEKIDNFDIINNFPEMISDNQWIIALYFCESNNFKDFHFFLQEKDGRWSSKYGYRDVLNFFDELPFKYVAPNKIDTYYFYSKYLITNPYIEAIKNKNDNLDNQTDVEVTNENK